MLDVACVCAGSKYNPELHVNQLYLAVKQHLGVPFRFNIITDQPEHPYFATIDCRTIQVPDIELGSYKLWWYKAYLFSAQFTDQVLYFDLMYTVTLCLSYFRRQLSKQLSNLS